MSQALQSARLRLAPADPSLAGRVAAFFARNASHLAPWEPRRAQLADALAQRLSLEQMAQAFADGTGWRWLLLAADDETRVLGSVAVTTATMLLEFGLGSVWAARGVAVGSGLGSVAQAVVMAAFAHRLLKVKTWPSAQLRDLRAVISRS